MAGRPFAAWKAPSRLLLMSGILPSLDHSQKSVERSPNDRPDRNPLCCEQRNRECVSSRSTNPLAFRLSDNARQLDISFIFLKSALFGWGENLLIFKKKNSAFMASGQNKSRRWPVGGPLVSFLRLPPVASCWCCCLGENLESIYLEGGQMFGGRDCNPLYIKAPPHFQACWNPAPQPHASMYSPAVLSIN